MRERECQHRPSGRAQFEDSALSGPCHDLGTLHFKVALRSEFKEGFGICSKPHGFRVLGL